MRALVINDPGAAHRLQWTQADDPRPGPSDLLVAVRAVGLNRADLSYTDYHFEALPSMAEHIAGIEFSGEVLEVGKEVSSFRPGDRVMAMANNAAADYVLVDHRATLRVPSSLSWEQAAAVPVAFLTAHNALVTNAVLQPGESVLVHAASSGVGCAATQLAKSRGAKVVFGTAGSPEKLSALRHYGVDIGIDYTVEDFAAVIERETRAKGVDVIFDMAGAAAFPGNMASCAVGGRILGVGRMNGRHAQIDLTRMSQRRMKLLGVSFRARTLAEFAAVINAFDADCLGDFDAQRLRPVVDRVFLAQEAEAAYAYLAGARQVGKTVIRFSEMDFTSRSTHVH